MTGPQAPVTESGPARQAGRGIGRAAVLIGSITVLARMVGFGRQLVFAHTVGATCLGTAYTTANQVPNIIYDIVLGGVLTSAVVPVLAGPAARRMTASAGPAEGQSAEARSGQQETSQIASALLTWTVLLLVPVSVIIAVMAAPLVTPLLSGAPGCSAAITTVSSRMLAVFAPQIVLYGLAVVLYGILQAHHRFTAPAVAPVLSSLVVIAAYIAYVPLGKGYPLGSLPLPAELMLSVGTTVGVAALALTALGPALRLKLRLRPALRFPDGVARRVRGLAAVGLAALVAQDASVIAVTVLANGHEGRGAVVLYMYGWQMFLVPWAVLAVPIAVSAFPLLSAREGAAFDDTAAAASRAVMLVSWLGAALLAGAAVPAARLFESHNPADARQLAITFVAFAPGLVGYGLAANLSRVLFACGRNRVAAVAIVAGWLLVIAADVIAVSLVRARWVVPVLGLGNTVGLTLSGLALLAAVRGARGGGALRGVRRAAAAGLAGALAGGAAGAAVSAGLPVAGFFPNAAVAVLACVSVVIVFGAAALVLDGGDLRAVASRARGRIAR